MTAPRALQGFVAYHLAVHCYYGLHCLYVACEVDKAIATCMHMTAGMLHECGMWVRHAGKQSITLLQAVAIVEQLETSARWNVRHRQSEQHSSNSCQLLKCCHRAQNAADACRQVHACHSKESTEKHCILDAHLVNSQNSIC